MRESTFATLDPPHPVPDHGSMKRAEVLAQLHDLLPQLTALGVVHLALFGSVARDEATGQSDIDVLVDIVGPRPFAQRVAVTDLLQAHFGCRVDVVPREALKVRAREVAEREALLVA